MKLQQSESLLSGDKTKDCCDIPSPLHYSYISQSAHAGDRLSEEDYNGSEGKRILNYFFFPFIAPIFDFEPFIHSISLSFFLFVYTQTLPPPPPPPPYSSSPTTASFALCVFHSLPSWISRNFILFYSFRRFALIFIPSMHFSL